MSEKVKKITKIEELPLAKELLDGSYTRKWIQTGLTAGPRVSDEDVIKFLKILQFEPKGVCWAEDPILAGKACCLLLAGRAHLFPQWIGKEIPSEWIQEEFAKLAESEIQSPYSHCRYGQHDAAWVAHLLAYEGTGIDLSEVQAMRPIVEGSGWWYYYDGYAIMTPRVTPKLDNRGDLHCEDGPAIWSLYALHSVVLGEEFEWVVKERDTLTTEKINNIDNAEVRAVVIATYPEKYIQDAPIAVDDYGELYDVNQPSYRLVKVIDPSSKTNYWLRCDPESTTPHQGVASTFGLTPEEYQPSIER